MSGCTASVGIVTHDKIFVVRASPFSDPDPAVLMMSRATPEIRDRYWALRAEQNLFHSTTSRRMRAKRRGSALQEASSILEESTATLL